MIRRSIAACVLASLCWLSVPVAFGSMPAGMMHSARRTASPAEDHSCCPRHQVRMTPALFMVATFPVMPCGEQHRCCARQRPASPSNVPAESKVIRPGAERMLANAADKSFTDRGGIVETSTFCFLPPPFERSTVLRI